MRKIHYKDISPSEAQTRIIKFAEVRNLAWKEYREASNSSVAKTEAGKKICDVLLGRAVALNEALSIMGVETQSCFRETF